MLAAELAETGVRIQAVLPGAVATELWDKSGYPLAHLDEQIVMTVDDAVDAALAGLDAGELITIPSLPDAAHWDAYEAARLTLAPNMSRREPAERYASALPLERQRHPPLRQDQRHRRACACS